MGLGGRGKEVSGFTYVIVTISKPTATTSFPYICSQIPPDLRKIFDYLATRFLLVLFISYSECRSPHAFLPPTRKKKCTPLQTADIKQSQTKHRDKENIEKYTLYSQISRKRLFFLKTFFFIEILFSFVIQSMYI